MALRDDLLTQDAIDEAVATCSRELGIEATREGSLIRLVGSARRRPALEAASGDRTRREGDHRGRLGRVLRWVRDACRLETPRPRRRQDDLERDVGQMVRSRRPPVAAHARHNTGAPRRSLMVAARRTSAGEGFRAPSRSRLLPFEGTVCCASLLGPLPGRLHVGEPLEAAASRALLRLPTPSEVRCRTRRYCDPRTVRWRGQTADGLWGVERDPLSRRQAAVMT